MKVITLNKATNRTNTFSNVASIQEDGNAVKIFNEKATILGKSQYLIIAVIWE